MLLGESAFGEVTLAETGNTYASVVNPTSLGWMELFGTPRLRLTLKPTSGNGGGGFGTANMITHQLVLPDAISTAVGLGVAKLIKAPYLLRPRGIASWIVDPQVPGASFVGKVLFPPAVQTGASFGAVRQIGRAHV